MNYNNAFSQGDWVEYLKTKEKDLMSIRVDLEFDLIKPNYKNLLIIGTAYKGCLKNGFPNDEGLEELYTFSDSTEIILNKITKSKLVGIITYKCIGLDIYYVKDTTNIRKDLENLYARDFSNTQKYIYIKKDKSREYFYTKLFPQNLSPDFFMDQEYLIDLAKAGDKLDDKRKVKHWMYFRKNNNRQKFSKNVKALEFQIDSVIDIQKDKYPYQLQISNENLVDPKSIFELTNLMKVLVKSSNGIYGGWGIEAKLED